jgi:hypothetical protein
MTIQTDIPVKLTLTLDQIHAISMAVEMVLDGMEDDREQDGDIANIPNSTPELEAVQAILKEKILTHSS